MVGQSARESAYAELVAGLIDVREDVATARFDAELAQAEADGRVDAATARALRWWQRAAVRAVVDHARTALPPVLAALDRAHDVAAEELAEAQRALDDAMALALPTAPESPVSAVVPEDQPQAVSPTMEETPEEELSLTPGPQPDLTPRRLLVAGLTPLPPS